MNNHIHINEDLKGRMLRRIAAIWGVKNTDALDPLVKLLVEALAGELHKTHNEIFTFEKRILEKIALLMTPGILSAPYSAHAIAQALPVEPTDILLSNSHFFYSKKKANDKDPQLNIHFTPVGNVRIFDATLKYLVAGNKIYSVDPNNLKSIFINGQYHGEQSKHIWLGIQLNRDIENLNQLSFFFDLKNTDQKKQFFQLFQSGKWFVKNREVNTVSGICYQDGGRIKDIFSDYDPMLQIEREIRHLYDDHFITLADENLYVNKENLTEYYPSEFEQIYTRSELSKFKEPLFWIKLVTPTLIDEKVLIDLIITINSFPVINRKLKEFIYRFKGINNIIPVHTDHSEYFLSVQSLRDSFDKEYKQIPYSVKEHDEVGTYSVRKSGTERIDARSSKEYLMYLVELIRDESAAFSSYGQDAVNNMVKELDKTLAQLEQRIKKNNNYNTDSYYYVTVQYQSKLEDFFMYYWTTNSLHANGIHAGTKLNVYQGSQVRPGTMQLLTTTLGGKNALEPSRHIDAYKYAMLSHNKIVTVEDIKAFCFFELGDKIEDVSVRKGLVVSENAKQGLIRCVEILLRKKRNALITTDKAEWDIILTNLRSKMELRSSLNLYFRFILED